MIDNTFLAYNTPLLLFNDDLLQYGMEKIAKTNKELRKFGLIFLGYLLFFAVLFSHHQHSTIFSYHKEIILGLLVLLIITWPKGLLPLNIVWHVILKTLQWINTRILLGILFFAVFSPIAFFRRLFKKDPLQLAYNQSLMSYRILTTEKENNDLRRPY